MSRTIDKTLDALENSKQLSPDGRAWLIAACDPFHDTDMTLAGYPDVLTASTVVQLVKKQVQLTVPASVTSGANWDCSIALMPSLFSSYINSCVSNVPGDGNVMGASASTLPNTYVGGLSIQSGNSGADLWPCSATPLPQTTPTVVSASQYLKGNLRLVAAGFEVVNTTASNYVQGQATVWRLPATPSPATFYAPIGTTPSAPCSATGVINRFPPPNIASAQLLFGSRSWAASEGAYVIARQSTMDNPPTMPAPRLAWYVPGDQDYVNSAVNSVYYTNKPLLTATMGPDIYAPFDISGVHFTGLSYQTTLTVTVRWFIERMPGPAEPDLVVLATPSSTYDPLALELYARCMRDMPPGVMVKENPMGEWFKAALGKVAQYAPKALTVASSLGVPGAGIAANVVRSLSTAGRPAPPPPPMPQPRALPQSMSNNSSKQILARVAATAQQHHKKGKKHSKRK